MPFFYEYNQKNLRETITYYTDELTHTSLSGDLGSFICDFLSINIHDFIKEGPKTGHFYFSIPGIREEYNSDKKAFLETIGRFIVFLKMCDKQLGFEGMNLDSFHLFLYMNDISVPKHSYGFPDIPKGFNFMNSVYLNAFHVMLSSKLKSNSDKFTCNGIQDLCIASLYAIVDNNFVIKKCNNCGKFFIPFGRSDSIYCDRKSPQDNTRTCKEYGSQKLWYEKLKKNESAKLYRNIYQAKQMLTRRHTKESDPILYEVYQSSFDDFKNQASQWKKDVKAGIKTEEAFIKWLEFEKQKKV